MPSTRDYDAIEKLFEKLLYFLSHYFATTDQFVVLELKFFLPKRIMSIIEYNSKYRVTSDHEPRLSA